MYKVKIYGAGSIGNHLAHAARSLGWEVHLCDINNQALERTKTSIYPERYGKWDDSIKLYNTKEVPSNIYDIIIVGTPPAFHMEVAIKALDEKPKAILIEKPLCTPDLSKAQELYELAAMSNTRIFVGYDHVLGMATQRVENIINSGALDVIQTLDVEFREHWRGIFNAHPWLSGPQDTYLGFWEKGGGASGEHSHAINLWQHIAHVIGAGRVVEVNAMLGYVSEGNASYDYFCSLNLKTESGLIGRVVQDVVTLPPRKWGRVQGTSGFVEWYFGFKAGVDAVFCANKNGEKSEHLFEKTRPDDFIIELKHICDDIEGKNKYSEISLERGLDTMVVLAAAHLSAREKRNVSINHDKGYVLDALDIL